MPAAYQELFLEKGSTFSTSITLDDVYGVPYDLTPKSGKMKGQLVKKGQSFHGQNTKDGFALNPPDEVGKALDAQKTLNLQINK